MTTGRDWPAASRSVGDGGQALLVDGAVEDERVQQPRADGRDSVLGHGWRRGDRALELRLALRMAELRRA